MVTDELLAGIVGKLQIVDYSENMNKVRITLILNDQDSVKNTIGLLKMFSLCSGLNINIDKTQVKYIGTLSSCDYYPHGLSWIKTQLETLGITIYDNDETSYKQNFQQRISQI